MKKVNLAEQFARFSEHWSPRVVGELNGQHVRLVKLQGEFVWHHHDHEDELFMVLRGRLAMHFRDRVVEVGEGEFVIVPRGVEHKPSAEHEAHVLLFEPAETLNTGNLRNERTIETPSISHDAALTRHWLDWVLIPFFAVSVIYGALFSLPEGVGVPVAPDSPWPPLRSLHGWAVEQEPTHLDPPRTLIASTLFDGFVQTPLLVALIYGLVRRRGWARPLGLIYAGAGVINMWFYFFETLTGPLPPPHLVTYLPFNLPWLIAPAVLGWRMWPRWKPARGAVATP